jgi:hypothetical protein
LLPGMHALPVPREGRALSPPRSVRPARCPRLPVEAKNTSLGYSCSCGIAGESCVGSGSPLQCIPLAVEEAAGKSQLLGETLENRFSGAKWGAEKADFCGRAARVIPPRLKPH